MRIYSTVASFCYYKMVSIGIPKYRIKYNFAIYFAKMQQYYVLHILQIWFIYNVIIIKIIRYSTVVEPVAYY